MLVSVQRWLPRLRDFEGPPVELAVPADLTFGRFLVRSFSILVRLVVERTSRRRPFRDRTLVRRRSPSIYLPASPQRDAAGIPELGRGRRSADQRRRLAVGE